MASMLSPSPPRVNDGTRTLSVRDRLGGEGRAQPRATDRRVLSVTPQPVPCGDTHQRSHVEGGDHVQSDLGSFPQELAALPGRLRAPSQFSALVVAARTTSATPSAKTVAYSPAIHVPTFMPGFRLRSFYRE